MLVLCVEVEHIERVARRIPVVNQALAASLSPSLCKPAQLPQSAPAWNNRPLLRAEGKSQLEGPIGLIVQVTSKRRSKDRGLDKAHGGSYANGVAPRKGRIRLIRIAQTAADLGVLTLARIKEGERQLGQTLAKSGVMDRTLLLGSLSVGSVVLMKSELRPTGPVYTKMWEVWFKAS